MPAELHVFGAGQARIGAVGATLNQSANGLGSIQSAALNVKFAKDELWNTPEVSMFPVDVGFHSGEASIKLEAQDINRQMIQYITGASKATVSTTDTYTIGQTAQPSKFRLELDLVTTDSPVKNVKIVLYRCYCTDLPIDFNLKTFAKMALEIFALPDPANSYAIGTVAMDQ